MKNPNSVRQKSKDIRSPDIIPGENSVIYVVDYYNSKNKAFQHITIAKERVETPLSDIELIDVEDIPQEEFERAFADDDEEEKKEEETKKEDKNKINIVPIAEKGISDPLKQLKDKNKIVKKDDDLKDVDASKIGEIDDIDSKIDDKNKSTDSIDDTNLKNKLDNEKFAKTDIQTTNEYENQYPFPKRAVVKRKNPYDTSSFMSKYDIDDSKNDYKETNYNSNNNLDRNRIGESRKKKDIQIITKKID